MLPPHPAVRARARIIMDHFNTQFVPLFYRILVRYRTQLESLALQFFFKKCALGVPNFSRRARHGC